MEAGIQCSLRRVFLYSSLRIEEQQMVTHKQTHSSRQSLFHYEEK